MAEATASHLSIGEVLALLLDEFPDVTISKIRFLESQGLINPERTPSGYRKFYDDDVDLLRCVLREQKENFLPLKVIKERLDTGEIDPTSEVQRPRAVDDVADPDVPDESMSSANHPATGRDATTMSTEPNAAAAPAPPSGIDDTNSIPMQPGVRLDAGELASMAGISAEQLEQLSSYGLVVADAAGVFDEDALEIARVAKRFLDLGVDARHLRGWRVAADREAGLFEQIIQPLVRQRNPQASEHAVAQLTELEVLGGQMRSALMRTLLRQHFDA
ncbi:MAG: MerR family transcriptional regulator [Actinomycetota bacterium]